MSDTPRTDASVIDNAELYDDGYGESLYVYANFARQLERELAAITAQLDALLEDKERLDAAVRRIAQDIRTGGFFVLREVDNGIAYIIEDAHGDQYQGAGIRGMADETYKSAVCAAIDAAREER